MELKRLGIALLFVSTFSFGGSLAYSEDLRKYIGIDEAIQISKEESAEIDIAKAGSNHARMKLTSAEQALNAVDQGVYPASYLASYSAWRSARASDQIARDNEQFTEDKLAMKTKKAYMDVYVAKGGVDAAQAYLKTTQETLRQINVKYKVGVVSKKDVLDAEVQVAAADVGLRQAQSAYSISLYKLKRKLGYFMTTDVILTDTFSFQPLLQPVNIDEAAESLFESTFSYKKLKLQKDALEDIVKEGEDENLTNTPAYADADISLEEINANIDSTKKDAALAIYAFFNGLKSTEYTINSLKKQIEAAQEALRIAKVSFKAGIVTASTVDTAALQVLNLQTKLVQNIYDYQFKKAQFEQNMFLESF